MAVEKVQGISRLEQLCEEFSEEERVRELKQEKKRQKRKNRRKNKCVCEIPAPLQAAEEKEINQAKVNMNWASLHPSIHPSLFHGRILEGFYCILVPGGI